MIRYRLDDLGWYQFEWLIQSLAKHLWATGVESWGGSADIGRDAYFTGSLEFPVKGLLKEGPFLFQAKFVENANAAGSDPRAKLLKAVKAEAESIKKRQNKAVWKTPRHFSICCACE